MYFCFSLAQIRISSFDFRNFTVFRSCRGFVWVEDLRERGLVNSEPDLHIPFDVLHKLEEEWVSDAEPPPKGVVFLRRTYDPQDCQSAGASRANRRHCSPCARKSAAGALVLVTILRFPCLLRLRIAGGSSTQCQQPRACGVVNALPSSES